MLRLLRWSVILQKLTLFTRFFSLKLTNDVLVMLNVNDDDDKGYKRNSLVDLDRKYSRAYCLLILRPVEYMVSDFSILMLCLF